MRDRSNRIEDYWLKFNVFNSLQKNKTNEMEPKDVYITKILLLQLENPFEY